MVQNEAYIFGNMFGLLCSSSSDIESKDSPNGGIFTIRFHEAIRKGLDSAKFRNKPILTLADISNPLVDALAKDGYSLPRLYIGPQLPPIALVKNNQYRPEFENFVPYMRSIIEYLWNNGNPIEVRISEFSRIGQGAYANHSKLSLSPWDLLADGARSRFRVLTERGIQFARGELEIPKRIIRDFETLEWIADPETEYVHIDDIGG